MTRPFWRSRTILQSRAGTARRFLYIEMQRLISRPAPTDPTATSNVSSVFRERLPPIQVAKIEHMHLATGTHWPLTTVAARRDSNPYTTCVLSDARGAGPTVHDVARNFIGAGRAFIAPVREFSPGHYSDLDERHRCRFSIDHDLERFQ
jgi:hypothetical protein